MKKRLRRVTKKATNQRPEDFRTRIGLAGAEIGDLHAAEQFLAFLKRELLPLSLFSELPEPIKTRFSVILHEAERAFEFTSGYRAATIKERTHAKA